MSIQKHVEREGSDKISMIPQNLMPKIPTKTVPRLPIFITKNNKITLIDGHKGQKLFLKNLQTRKTMYKPQVTVREDIIYQSKEGDFLRGNPLQNIVLFNRLNLINNSCRTVAQFTHQFDKGAMCEKTSDAVTKIIGQENFDTVLSALCSVINQELKVKAIMGLLVEDKNDSVQQEKKKSFAEKCCQTDENCMELIYRIKQKKKIKRSQLIPYVVQDGPAEKKRVVVHPENAKLKDNSEDNTFEITEKYSDNSERDLPELKSFNEDSNASTSTIGNVSTLSGLSMNFKYKNLLHNPSEIFSQIDQCTANEKLDQIQLTELKKSPQNGSLGLSDSAKLVPSTMQTTAENSKLPQSGPQISTVQQSVYDKLNPTCITLLDGTRIMVPIKPEDYFHIATPEILKNVTADERKKLLWYQAYIDWKLCLQQDEDDNL